MNNVVRFPCDFEIKQTARAVLSDPGVYTKDQVLAAIGALEHERDWETRRLVSTAQNRYLWAVPGSDIVPADAPKSGDNFRRLTDEQMASIGLGSHVPARPSNVPNFVPDYDLRILLIGAGVMITAGLGIGHLLQMFWGAV